MAEASGGTLPLAGVAAASALATLGLAAGGAGEGWLIAAAASGFASAAGVLGALAMAGRPAVEAIPSVEDGSLRLRFEGSGEVGEASGDADGLLGVPLALLLADGLFQRLHVADRVAFLCGLSAVREGEGARSLPLRLRLPRGEGGEPAGYRTLTLDLALRDGQACGTLRDRCEVERLEAELGEAREALSRMEKRRSEAMAATGHELRTPLNAIIGFSEMLGRESLGGFSDPRQRDYAELIRQSGHHLIAVVDGILQASLVEAGAYRPECKPFAFADAVERSRAMVGMSAEAKRVSIVCEVAPSCGVVRGDLRTVQQILINLLSNAVKFTPPGGEVRVGGQRVGSKLHLWVRDNGVGIAPDDVARLGRPFVRVGETEAQEGTGLGLSLVRALTEAQNGTLSIESTPGEGTLVSVSLPVDLANSPRKLEVAHAQGTDPLALRKTA